MARFTTIDDIDVADKRVLVRVDLNVPMKDGQVTDDTRLRAAAKTIEDLAERGAKLVVMSHFGRPKCGPDPELSLRPLAAPLKDVLKGRKVIFAEDCIGPVAEQAVSHLHPGEVVLLENLRFHKGEEADDIAFVSALARLGDVWVSDAFSCAHRAHASTHGLGHKLPAAAGRTMQAELEALDAALGSAGAGSGVVALVGGAKVSTKISVLKNLSKKVDALIVAGAMANTFLAAQGVEVGASLYEKDMMETAREIVAAAEANNCRIVLPVDAVVAADLEPDALTTTVDIHAVPKDMKILDIGRATVDAWTEVFDAAKILVWNGPAGAFEIPPFHEGTDSLARRAASACRKGRLKVVAGGGDTVAALAHARVIPDLTYVSTAGGAFLEWLEGRALPGVVILEKNCANGK